MKRSLLLGFFLLLYLFGLRNQVFAQNKVVVLSVEDYIINPIIYEYICAGLKKAEEENAPLLIKLDTPGGLLESTRKIVKKILNSDIPVIVYVYPQGSRAASAGVFITLSAHIAAMSPSTHIGSAHPVIMNKSWGQIDEELKKKVINDTLSWVENIAKKRKRNVRWAKKAVEESVSADETQALRLKIIDLIAQDTPELLKKLDGRMVNLNGKNIFLKTKGARLISLEMSLRQKLLNALINPQIAYILMVLGFFALLYEVTHPGFGFPGIFGVIALLLAFYAFQVLPVNYAGLSLIILGIIFLIVEIFTPTFGLFTAGGLSCLILGSLMLFNQKVPFLKIPLKFILSLTISISIITLFVLTKAVSIQRKKPLTGKESLIGKTGVALQDIEGEGKIELDGQIWTAKTKDKIKKGEEVSVEKIEGLKLVVKKKEVKDVS